MINQQEYATGPGEAANCPGNARVILMLIREDFDVPAPPAAKVPHYVAGYIESYSGTQFSVRTPLGRHEFSRATGAWSEGPCTNYIDAVVLNHDEVEQAIREGLGGDVAALRNRVKKVAPDIERQLAQQVASAANANFPQGQARGLR